MNFIIYMASVTYSSFLQMSGVQGIVVCGEASESDEEEEFCAAMARDQLGK